MVGEILRNGRRRARSEIGGACARHPADGAQPGRDQAAVGQVADAQGDVDLVVEEVGHAVGQHQLDGHFGERREEGGDDRQDVQPAEHDRGGDDKVALGLGVLAGRGALGLVQLLQDRLGRRDVGPAGGRQLQALGRADQEIRLQVAFELGHLAAHGGERLAEFAAGLGEAAALHRREHHLHRVQTIHKPTRMWNATSLP